ncbi:MAG: hypothetical protein Q9165_000762 [Trypethelium subeluteriae]
MSRLSTNDSIVENTKRRADPDVLRRVPAVVEPPASRDGPREVDQAAAVTDSPNTHSRQAGARDQVPPTITPDDAGDEYAQASYATIYDFLQKISWDNQKTLQQCAFGHYPEIWYKFKRFETLSLLNLYHYQQELVGLEKSIMRNKGVMSRDERNCLRIVLKDYYEAIHLFKEISQMGRPSKESRKETVNILAEALAEDHYVDAADALGLLDLTPQALGVEPDSIRVWIAKTVSRLASEGPEGDLKKWYQGTIAQKISNGVLEQSITTSAYDRRVNGTSDELVSKVNEYLKEQDQIEAQRERPTDYTNNTLQVPHRNGQADNGNAEATTATGTVNGIIVTRIPGNDTENQHKLFRNRPFAMKISPAVDQLARVAVALFAGVFLLAPMIALSYIGDKKWSLITTCLFVLAFAIIASFASKATNQELLTATAAYAAVLVVFVGQISQSNFRT